MLSFAPACQSNIWIFIYHANIFVQRSSSIVLWQFRLTIICMRQFQERKQNGVESSCLIFCLGQTITIANKIYIKIVTKNENKRKNFFNGSISTDENLWITGLIFANFLIRFIVAKILSFLKEQKNQVSQSDPFCDSHLHIAY